MGLKIKDNPDNITSETILKQQQRRFGNSHQIVGLRNPTHNNLFCVPPIQQPSFPRQFNQQLFQQHPEGQSLQETYIGSEYLTAVQYEEPLVGSLPPRPIQEGDLNAILEPIMDLESTRRSPIDVSRTTVFHQIESVNSPSPSIELTLYQREFLPQNFSFNKREWAKTMTSREDIDQGLNLVAQFPQKEKLDGFEFQVSFPSDSPKLVISQSHEGDVKRIHSVNDSNVAIFFNHNAGPKAKIRLLVVFSNDGESTTAVHPCRNHQNTLHPDHILDVSGVVGIKWETHPHPSIVIVPCETNGSVLSGPLVTDLDPMKESATSMHQTLPSFCAQLRFLCRNSCLTRKDLTLICQLEKDDRVLARECFFLKVSACPRRDAKAKKGSKITAEEIHQRIKRRATWDLDERDNKKATTSTETTEELIETNKTGSHERMMPVPNDTFSAIANEAKKSALFHTMAKCFQRLHPEEYETELQKFEQWWKSYIKGSAL